MVLHGAALRKILEPRYKKSNQRQTGRQCFKHDSHLRAVRTPGIPSKVQFLKTGSRTCRCCQGSSCLAIRCARSWLYPAFLRTTLGTTSLSPSSSPQKRRATGTRQTWKPCELHLKLHQRGSTQRRIIRFEIASNQYRRMLVIATALNRGNSSSVVLLL